MPGRLLQPERRCCAALDDLADELISAVLDLSCPSQHVAAALMLVSKRFREAARCMSCWDALDWRSAAK